MFRNVQIKLATFLNETSSSIIINSLQRFTIAKKFRLGVGSQQKQLKSRTTFTNIKIFTLWKSQNEYLIQQSKSSIIGKWWPLYLTLLRWSAYDVLEECILRGHQASSTSRHFWWELMLRSTFGHTKFEFYFSRICIILATRNDSIDAAREDPALPSSKQLRTGESNYSPHSSRRAKRENW